MFLGYASKSKGCRSWSPDSKKVIQNWDVTFNESAMFSPGKESTISSTISSDQHDTSDKAELEVST